MNESTKTNPRRRGRKLLFRVGALAVGLVIAAVLAEVLVLALFGEQPKFPRRVVEAPWGIRYNEPGARYRHKSADVSIEFRINQAGMRADRDYPYEKPEGTKRIVSLGDSFAMGYEVDAADCFASVLERNLREIGENVEVLNAGVSGFSNAEESVYLEKELLKYDPDVVVLSFYSNDLKDNVRSGIFELDGETLVQKKSRYVPAGSLGNFLNSNWFFNLLSERSNAFVFLKEQATVAVKRSMEAKNEARAETEPPDARPAAQPPASPHADSPRLEQRKRLTAAILERVEELLTARGIPFVLQIIPSQPGGPDLPLDDRFPYEHFDSTHVHVVSMAKHLAPFVGKELLYWQRSHAHWTPFSHSLSAKALSQVIVEQKLLD